MDINAIAPRCRHFSERFNTLYYWRQVSPAQVQQVLQAHSEGSRLRGISRITGLADNTIVSLDRAEFS
ncbi:MAG: hypothetical protein KME42_23675 [Tildeniella nuda ZEHNDER 1965/U140]|nr:hypothetical protein [Tildeniella nuda ZEHNDER 1965/U140]